MKYGFEGFLWFLGTIVGGFALIYGGVVLLLGERHDMRTFTQRAAFAGTIYGGLFVLQLVAWIARK